MLTLTSFIRLILPSAFVFSACTHADETLCRSGETVYFSCKIVRSGKLISLCGNALDKPDRFWLQYRFGSRKKLELAYPERKVSFSHSGFDVDHLRRVQGFDTEVSFSRGGWSYTVFHSMPGEGKTDRQSGLFVARNRAGPGTTFRCSANPNFGVDRDFFRLGEWYGKN
jgi:hypothetical protein